jgi:hypothetical protein
MRHSKFNEDFPQHFDFFGVVSHLLIHSATSIRIHAPNQPIKKLIRDFHPRAARHIDNTKGVAEISPGLAESARPTPGTAKPNPLFSSFAHVKGE